MMVFKGTVNPRHHPPAEACCVEDPCCLPHRLLWVREETAADIFLQLHARGHPP